MNITGVIELSSQVTQNRQVMLLQTFLFQIRLFHATMQSLKNALKDAIDAERPRFQLKIYFKGLASDEDSQLDGWVYQQNDVKLSIAYIQDS